MLTILLHQANSFSAINTRCDSVAVESTRQNDNLTDSVEGIDATPTYIGRMRPETPTINHEYILSDLDADDTTSSSYGIIILNSTNSSQPNDTLNNFSEANSFSAINTRCDSVTVESTSQKNNLTDYVD
ncbi:hypothetical protein RF11_13445 [Thelohanellus kitauei]|uniref:Uncharacterized protein n=1 Tax=Thelohanellus kitauei TaxID=669202 RepID=A0A0C2N6F8_THEKT|nr:hypothetical protein RF11_13445 [Thelohanellus kitauei]